MIKFILSVALLLNFIGSAFANNLFSEIGKISSFDYNPEAYDLRHAINYYLPSSYNQASNSKVMILLHGGGASTSTYRSSKQVAIDYMKDFVKYAEKNNMIIIAPATSVGWSFVTRILASEVIKLAKQELSIDTNKIVLFGHSMGGMGITRDAHWIVDRFSGIMPTAAGMDDKLRVKTHYLNTYFNVPFIHINGDQDHFDVFKINSLATESDIRNILEPKYDMKSQYELLFHPGGHNYDLRFVYRELDKLFLKSRNLYQERLFPLFQNLSVRGSQYGPDSDYVLNQYFWLKVDFKDNTPAAIVNGYAEIKNNEIIIDMNTKDLKSLKILLSEKNIVFSNPIKVILNGKLIKEVTLKKDNTFTNDLIQETVDKNFIFENMITLNF